jgi:hypothetical protein
MDRATTVPPEEVCSLLLPSVREEGGRRRSDDGVAGVEVKWLE